MRRSSVLVAGLLVAVVSPGAALAGSGNDTVGVIDVTTGIWYLRDASGATTSFFYGNPGDYPMVGDWDCDGTETPGLYRQSDGFVYLRNSNSQGVADIRFFFGNPSDIPLAGDFDGDGCDTVSIYRPSESRVYIINELGQNEGGLGAAELAYYFGNPGDKPFVGDFDDDGIDTVGLHRESTGLVYFRNSHTQGVADFQFIYGDPGDRIIAGDWDQKPTPGEDTVGIFRPSVGTIYLRFSNSQGNADTSFVFGNQNMRPVAGNFGPLPGGSAPPPSPAVPSVGGKTADHTAVAAYDSIPASIVAQVADLDIYYSHTSHGSQLVTGVEMMPAAFQFNNLVEAGQDLGYSGWNITTDNWLAAHPETDVVVWSWCGQQSSNSVDTVQGYLNKMAALEAKYPSVQFIYMTGHLRGAYEYFYEDAENLVLQRNNQMVRDYAEANGKWLFDFADIESYLDGSTSQCTYHGMPVECTWPNNATGCAHSRMGNCDRKGKAFYTLLAEMIGWAR